MPLPAQADVVVECRDLSLVRRTADGHRLRVLDGVGFVLRAGQTLAVLGTTRAGKSSLGDALAGTGRPRLSVCGGDATVVGISVRRRGRTGRARDYAVGHVPQRHTGGLPAHLSVGEAIAAPVTSRTRHANDRALGLRVATLLDEMMLPLGAADRRPHELSAGMRRRALLARALMLDPAVLVADGVLAGLDARARTAVLQAIARRRDGRGMAVVLIGEDAATARELHAAVLVLRGGWTVAAGRDPDSVLWAPDTPDIDRILLAS